MRVYATPRLETRSAATVALSPRRLDDGLGEPDCSSLGNTAAAMIPVAAAAGVGLRDVLRNLARPMARDARDALSCRGLLGGLTAPLVTFVGSAACE